MCIRQQPLFVIATHCSLLYNRTALILRFYRVFQEFKVDWFLSMRNAGAPLLKPDPTYVLQLPKDGFSQPAASSLFFSDQYFRTCRSHVHLHDDDHAGGRPGKL
jgi:hypothetical protein